jgi:hypothetical protein
VARKEPAVGVSIDGTVVRALAIDPATVQPVAASVTPVTGTLAEALREGIRALRVRPAKVTTAFGLDRATVRRMTLPQTTQQNITRMVRWAERHPLPGCRRVDYHAIPDRSADRLDVVPPPSA